MRAIRVIAIQVVRCAFLGCSLLRNFNGGSCQNSPVRPRRVKADWAWLRVLGASGSRRSAYHSLARRQQVAR